MKRMESGQAIVVVALMLVGLIGMTGLAIDGGGLYFLQRNAQTAADAAVLAATYSTCAGGDTASMQSAAEQAIADNGLSDAQVIVEYPPTSGEGTGDDDYVAVNVVARKPSYFVQLVYKGPLEVTSRAVGYCRRGYDSEIENYVLVTTSTNCPYALNIPSSTRINGGVHSNADLHIGTSAAAKTVSGPTDYAGELFPARTTFSPAALDTNATVDYPDFYQAADYAPGGPKALAAEAAGEYRYIDATNGVVQLSSTEMHGLIYVNGSVHIVSAVSNRADLASVTLVATGRISIAGNEHKYMPFVDGLVFFSTRNSPCPTLQYHVREHHCGGDTFIQAPVDENSPAIVIDGAFNELWGVMYAPNGHIHIPSDNSKFYGAIIANTMKADGATEFHYRHEFLASGPPSVQIAE